MNNFSLNDGLVFSNGGKVWAAIATVLLLFGLYGVAQYLMHGMEVYNTYRQVPWGILISTYVFFVVSSTGLCLVSSLGHVFGFKQFDVIGKRAIAMAIFTITAGFMVIATEIGHPLRMVIYNILTPNLKAAIWWMGTLYGLYLACIIVEFFFLLRGNHKLAGLSGLAGFIAGVAAHSNLGAVFGFLGARSWWHGPYLPIYFILSAAVTGCAIIILLMAYRYANDKMPDETRQAMLTIGRIFCFLLGVLIFFEIWKVLTSIYNMPPGKYETMMILLTGPLAANFWFFEILLGMVLPFSMILVTKARNMPVIVAAAVSSLIGIFFMRYNLVVAGQLLPLREDVHRVGADGLLTYTPSMVEIMIVVGGIGACLLMYIVANMIFNLDADEEAHH